MHDYVRRAVELSYKYNGTQLKDLRDRLFNYMCLIEDDRRLQERVGDRLYNARKIEADGQLADATTFDNIYNQIVGYSIHPGEESNPFFKEPPPQLHIEKNAPTSQDQLMLETMKTLKAM